MQSDFLNSVAAILPDLKIEDPELLKNGPAGPLPHPFFQALPYSRTADTDDDADLAVLRPQETEDIQDNGKRSGIRGGDLRGDGQGGGQQGKPAQ